MVRQKPVQKTVDLSQIAATHYHEKLSNENRELKLEKDETHRRLVAESTQKINRWKECSERILNVVIYSLVFGVFILGVVGTIVQFVNHTDLGVINSILLLLGLVGVCDTIFSRFRFIRRLIAIASNKLIQIVEKKENERIRNLLGMKNEQ